MVDPNEIVTYYVVEICDHLDKRVWAWSDDKDLVKAYLDFHKCKNLKVTKMTNTAKFCSDKLINENLHDELGIYYIHTKNPDKHSDEQMISIAVPMTMSERMPISDEIQTYMASRCNYHGVNRTVGFLKNKYQHALQDILYWGFMKSALVESAPNPFISAIQFDELRIFLMIRPDLFGKG